MTEDTEQRQQLKALRDYARRERAILQPLLRQPRNDR
jgi:hypothetical protein